MWLFGLILIALAAGLAMGYRSQARRLALLQSTENATVEHLRQLAASMSEGLGPGALRYMTEVRGVVRCEHPLSSELAKVPCVYYSMRVSREYEETYYTQDQHGRRQRRTRSGSEIVSSNQRSVPFEVEDATGRIRVEPDGAQMVSEKALSRFEPGESGAGRIELGGVSFDLPALGSGRRTLGYRLEEEVVPVDRQIYVLGEVTDQHGELRIRTPEESGKFLISLKGEAQLTSELEGRLKMMKLGAIGAGVLGGILLLAGVLGMA